LRSFQLNKKYLNKTKIPDFLKINNNLPNLKSLEINLNDKIREELPHACIMSDIEDFINHYINDKDRAFLSKLKPLKATLLYAHGGKHKKFKWCFIENQRSRSILKWIREKDGKFDLIIVIACNPGNCSGKVETKKSFLIMLSKIFYWWNPAEDKTILIKPKNSKRLTK